MAHFHYYYCEVTVVKWSELVKHIEGTQWPTNSNHVENVWTPSNFRRYTMAKQLQYTSCRKLGVHTLKLNVSGINAM